MKENKSQKIVRIIMKYIPQLEKHEALMFDRMLDEIEFISKNKFEYANNFMERTHAFFEIYRPDLYKKIIKDIQEEVL